MCRALVSCLFCLSAIGAIVYALAHWISLLSSPEAANESFADALLRHAARRAARAAATNVLVALDNGG
jgi:hypothetical protein